VGPRAGLDAVQKKKILQSGDSLTIIYVIFVSNRVVSLYPNFMLP
jgi:hypothetical protein